MAVWCRRFKRYTFCVVLLCFAISPLLAGSWTLAPRFSLYPASIADQKFPRFSLSFPVYLRQYIDTLQDEGFGGLREVLEFGGVKSLFRYTSGHERPVHIEYSLGAGVVTLFDSFEENLENFGWEGAGFLTMDVGIGSSIAFRFGFHHLSSHVGDEYLARYGAVAFPIASGEDLERSDTFGLDYVRDSLLGSFSIVFSEFLRAYAEVRYSMDMLRYMHCYNDIPWQASAGVEFQWPSHESNWRRWYLAIHTSAYQESSWYPSTSVQFGRMLQVPDDNQRFRYGMEWYHGRAQIAAFNHTGGNTPIPWNEVPVEQYVAIGAWYDF